MAKKRALTPTSRHTAAAPAVAEKVPRPGPGRLFPSLIAAAGILVYLNTLAAPFIFDDRYHIVENPRIRQFWPPWDILTHSSRPVIHLSLALNYALGGLHPWGYHVFNIAVHILAALVLYGLLRRTLLSSRLRPRWGAAARPLSGLIALIWLVHPLQTESVTYTIQRGESLMGLFYLLTVYSVARLDGSRRDIRWQAAAVASCLLGMACKGVMATAPLVALLYDRVFFSPSWRELLHRRKWLYTALAATWLVYPILLAQAPAEWKESAGFDYAGASPLIYALTQAGVILHYLRLAVLPVGLSLDYGWPPVAGLGEAFLPVLVVGALVAASVWTWRRYPAWGFAGAWFFVILIPTSSFLPIADLAVEHRMYLSLAAIVTLAVVGMVLAGQAKGTAPIRIPRYAWAACGVIIVALSALTVNRNADYSSDLVMWQETARVSPGNPRAQYDLGTSLEHAGRIQEAVAHYRTALQLKPAYVDALNNLGHVLSVAGNAAEGAGYLQRAIALKPDLAEAHCNLGYALAQQGKVPEAAPEFERALRLKPDYADAHNDWAIVLALEGKTEEAMSHWQEALRLNPDLADAHNNLAFALAEHGRTAEALAHYNQAVRLNPDYVQANLGLAKLLATLPPAAGGDPGRAITLAEHACQLTGSRDPAALETLATAYAAAGRRSDASTAAASALQLARSQNRRDLAAEIEPKLQLYRSGNR